MDAEQRVCSEPHFLTRARAMRRNHSGLLSFLEDMITYTALRFLLVLVVVRAEFPIRLPL
jgi:hypothetical protein